MLSLSSSLALAAILSSTSSAQQTANAQSMRYVMPNGNGAISVTISNDWQPEQLSLLDDGTRLILQLNNKHLGIVASYILFPNHSGTPTSEGCRSAVMQPVLENLRPHTTITGEESSLLKTSSGETLAVQAYTLEKADNTPIQQKNIFGFMGNTQTCAEVHLSKVKYKPSDEPDLRAVLNTFTPELSYIPKPADYGLIASILFSYVNDPRTAATYYQRTLDTLPASDITAPGASLMGRMTAVQLAMSYGMTGDLKRSREISQAAVDRDPDFPLYYYNLACADAESNDTVGARKHLQQAFDRRANMLQSLKLPDPTKDDSLLKLKSDSDFWAFVQALPKN